MGHELFGSGVVERRPQGATHSFRLTPGAYSVLEAIPKKSKAHRGRSAWVSEAIQWYGSSTSMQVSSQMGNIIFPNMAVASPEELHLLAKELQARVVFWVERSDAFEKELNKRYRAGSPAWFRQLRLKKWLKWPFK